MVIRYDTDIKTKLHLFIFAVLNSMRGWGLNNTDLKVLASLYNKDFELMKQYPEYSDRMVKLFSKEGKEDLMKSSGTSYFVLGNSLSKLRKKGFIKANMLEEKLLLNLDKDEFNLTVKIRNEGRN